MADPSRKPRERCTIAVSDGICMGQEGMRVPLVSRAGIADSGVLATHATLVGSAATGAVCG